MPLVRLTWILTPGSQSGNSLTETFFSVIHREPLCWLTPRGAFASINTVNQ
jgi:hypothetical protein